MKRLVLESIILTAAIALPLGSNPEKSEALVFPPREGWHLVYPVRVVDGDTVVFWWLLKDTARLNGINTPELKDKGGKEAKEFLERILPKKAIPALVYGKDKFGRTLLDLYIDNNTASERLLKAGHAKPWDGKGVRP